MPRSPISRINARLLVDPLYRHMHLGAHDLTYWNAYKTRPEALDYYGCFEVWAAIGSTSQSALVEDYKDWLAENKGYAKHYYNWSGTTTRDEALHAPRDFVLAGTIGEDGILDAYYDQDDDPTRRYIDLTQESVREIVVNDIVSATVASGRYHGIGIDNISYTDQAVPPITEAGLTASEWWTAQREFLILLSETAAVQGLDIMVNAAMSPAQATAEGLRSYVKHWSYELAFHPVNTLPYPTRIKAEIDAITEWCGNGANKYSPWSYSLEYGGVPRSTACRILAASLMLARTANDRTFVHYPSVTPVRAEWFSWPSVLGAPLAAYTQSGKVFTRRFQRGTLRVDYGRLTTSIKPSTR